MLRLITAATEAAVSIDEFKIHARLDGHDEDSDILTKLTAAQDYIADEELGGRALTTSTWEYSIEGWPCRSYFEMPLGNLQSVTWIKYTDSAGTVNTWSSAEYKLVRAYAASTDGTNDAGLGRVWLGVNRCWPSAMLDTGEPITIRFVAGWKDAAHVPAKIKAAIELMAAHLYRNREAVTTGNMNVESKPLAMAVEALCSKYAVRKF